MDLQDRKAFVSGGSGGLGRSISRKLAEQGVHVAVGFNNNCDAAMETCSMVENYGCSSVAIELDQLNPQSIESSVKETIRVLGGLDILVNNAAWNIPIPFSDLDALDDKVWDRLMGTNLRGPYLLSRSAAPYLRENGSGRIVNISAFIGLLPMGSSMAHAVSKAGLIHLTRCLAVALAPDVTVNSVAPGVMEGTGMSSKLSPEMVDSIRERAALNRTASIEDVSAQVIQFCKANSVTGQTLVIDGGIAFH